ncbi:signal transduction histidine kinase [Sphingomonas jinjuensis]|uniref:histidine kinase n=1 Tax=Sphingomonas jinjuensis TaxID=535907 RepID=A0A840FA14_9SPHN|nr:ATP-binding protein [Sphingomonas jinjuensis]MBB4154499.1 signal transduction histidine kinase [Sphingomonas jinjuensis]
MAVLGAAVLVALILTLGNANAQRDRALAQQKHSYDVMILARTLSGTIARAEASLGRYVISTDRNLGQLYYDQWRLAKSQLDRLDQITNDNAEQQPRIDQLRRAFEERGDQLSLTALNINYGQNPQALSRYYKARQGPALAAIDGTLNDIIARERKLLDERAANAARTVDRSSRIAGILSTAGLLIVLGAIAMGWLTIEAVGQRAIARAEAEAARERAEELATAVTAATDELRAQEAKLRQVQKMDAVGKLTGGIAHDFNNMLAVVLGGLELARRSVDNDPAVTARHIDNATDGANRAAALTRRLLAFSREDSLRPESIAPGSLVDGMTDLLDRTLGDAITVETVDEAGDWRVRADRVQLENAILNLAVNARDAMNGRGCLHIATGAATLGAGQIGHSRAGDYVTIALADEGCGMTPEVRERVFEPFFTTKEAGKGTGLGLSQIFALARQLGGEIAIDTAVGRGTTVTLYLPRDLEARTAGEVLEIAAPATVTPGSLEILVVEDDPRVLNATTGALAELGHVAIPCGDPMLAGELLERHSNIDLIISDVLMPGRTGPEMIAAVGPLFPHIAVLFVTGFAGEADASQFGSHQVLRKPFTLAGLERAIGEAMAHERPAPPDRMAAE